MIYPTIDIVNKYVGVPFKYGGRNIEEGLDCVGLVMSFLSDNNIFVNDDGKSYDENWWKCEDQQRLIRAVLNEGKIVDIPIPFDILCFKIKGIVKHIGVCVGYGKFLHTYKTKSGIGKLSRGWKEKLEGIVRPKGSPNE